jgi:hypothetical protein
MPFRQIQQAGMLSGSQEPTDQSSILVSNRANKHEDRRLMV